ncbi:MAG: phosphatase PAP2 family protein [Filimonas sp.]|nr:phosphatase PAP2 family protein [Filimonas sp.]
MKKTLLILLVLLNCFASFSQSDSTRHKKIYRVRLGYELPSSIACIGLSNLGFKALGRTSYMSESDVLRLNPNDINAFDRPIAFNDPSHFASAQKTSDLFLNISVVSPALMLFDKKIRKDWLDLLTMYMVAHAMDNAIYFGAAFAVRRPRPLTYNPGVSMADRTGDGKSNSFFSGHMGFSTTATFFAAKVFTDYNHIKGWNRILIYGAAAVPPAIVGYYRMKAGRHFKTDVIAGFISGAVSGILVPELHRIKDKHQNISFAPYYTPGASGLTVNVGL